MKTKIEWTDKTWNPVTGCTKVSQGCKNCYAETVANRFWGDRKFTDVQIHPERLDQPLHWRKPSRIFVNSMSDLFHENVPDSFIEEVFAVMAIADHHVYQILTKRPSRMKDFLINQDWIRIGKLVAYTNQFAAKRALTRYREERKVFSHVCGWAFPAKTRIRPMSGSRC